MQNIRIKNLRTFVAAKDYNHSRNFYKKLGFEETYHAEDLSVFRIGDYSFYLQNYYNKDWAENTMLLLEVNDVDAFWEHLLSLNLEAAFPAIRMRKPMTEKWGRECHLVDPAGVLWHFASFN